jgi:hypothetical protein
MAGQAEPSPKSELDIGSGDLRVRPGGNEHRDRVREAAAKLYGQGFERKHIARMMVEYLGGAKTFEDGVPRPLEQRLSQARTRLRGWEADQAFRDMIYNLAVVKLDLQTPAILGGIAKKAKKGRVDAARLALEITGRHNPKGDQVPTQIALVVEGVPRPVRAKAVTADGEVVVELNGHEILEEPDEDV